jgi:hypothetical protein
MAKSGQIDLRSISAAADDVGRHRIAANRTLRPQRTNSTTADDSLSLSDGTGKKFNVDASQGGAFGIATVLSGTPPSTLRWSTTYPTS